MNILFLTNPTVGCYGYSLVTKNICKGLKKAGHNTWVLSTMPTGNLIKDEYGTPNIPTYFEVYGKYALRQYIKALDIDVVITLLDCWDPKTYEIPDIVHKFKIPLISHVTTRSYPLSPFWTTFLQRVDHIITPTQWGKRIVEEVFPGKVSYIQHGVDLKVFRPDKNARKKMRKRLGYEDKFVFLAVGRNKEMQKRYDFMFKAFKALLTNVPETKNKVVLHIHTNPHEQYNLEDLRKMGYHDIGEHYVNFSYVKTNGDKLELCKKDDPRAMTLNPHWGLNEKGMAELYNMADCFVHSGEGESFCLPVLESQACGLPSVVPAHSSFIELVGKTESGILCKIATEETTPTITDVSLVNILDLAKAMAIIYKNNKIRENCSKNALKNAKKYGWNEVVKKWLFIIENITKPKPINYNVKHGKIKELGI
ncbi:MAG: glycosyltransferase family 4 protein [Candidatus Heimdallarchaeaceae archaeon]